MRRNLEKLSLDWSALGINAADISAKILSARQGAKLAQKRIKAQDKKNNRVRGLEYIKKELVSLGYRDIADNPTHLKEFIRLLSVPEYTLYGNIAKGLTAASLMAGWNLLKGKALKGKEVPTIVSKAIGYVGDAVTGAATETVIDKIMSKIEKGLLTRQKIKKAAEIYSKYKKLTT